jgi:hypothetical protein
MRDLRVVDAKTILPVYSVTPIRGFYPPSIIIIGERMDQATEVEFNYVLAEEFIISSPSRLIVKIPEAQVGKEMTSLRVLSPVSVSTVNALLSLGLTSPMKSVAGMDRLVQAWYLIFMTTPGSDIFDKDSGAGASKIIGSSTDSQHEGASISLAMAVSRTDSELKKRQASAQNVPLDEKLLSSSLETLGFDPKTSTIKASVTLKNMLGQYSKMSLG